MDEKEIKVGELELREYMPVMGELLRRGYVDRPVIIRDGRVENPDLVLALKSLGVRLIPVSNRDEEINVSLEDLGFYDDVKGSDVRVFNDAVELLYRNWPTPIVRVRSLSKPERSVWAKLEFYNPFSNSIKDRIAWYMFEKAKSEKGLSEAIYEASSSNTGIALASLAATHGLKAKIFVPKSVQKVTDTYLRVLGADVVRVDKSLTVEAIDEVDELARKNGATHLNQFYNDANFLVHLRYTAKEVEYQFRSMGRMPRTIVAGIGTSGHLSALSFYFKNRRPGTEIVAVQPAREEVIPGIRRLETGMKWVDYVEVDRVVDVRQEEAVNEAIRFARSEGILIGLSSGAVLAAYKKILGEKEGDVLLIFPDSGFKYFEFFKKYL